LRRACSRRSRARSRGGGEVRRSAHMSDWYHTIVRQLTRPRP
jgi:hypothetical protein